ncbi:MAG: ATP-NAD kinase-like domain-containing protein [Piptocephalis tieghemiana]|nr:MAG: ATP-NAD kinase-like domain-containing protein [Piptocephalis tieghemiana]
MSHVTDSATQDTHILPEEKMQGEGNQDIAKDPDHLDKANDSSPEAEDTPETASVASSQDTDEEDALKEILKEGKALESKLEKEEEEEDLSNNEKSASLKDEEKKEGEKQIKTKDLETEEEEIEKSTLSDDVSQDSVDLEDKKEEEEEKIKELKKKEEEEEKVGELEQKKEEERIEQVEERKEEEKEEVKEEEKSKEVKEEEKSKEVKVEEEIKEEEKEMIVQKEEEKEKEEMKNDLASIHLPHQPILPSKSEEAEDVSEVTEAKEEPVNPPSDNLNQDIQDEFKEDLEDQTEIPLLKISEEAGFQSEIKETPNESPKEMEKEIKDGVENDAMDSIEENGKTPSLDQMKDTESIASSSSLTRDIPQEVKEIGSGNQVDLVEEIVGESHPVSQLTHATEESTPPSPESSHHKEGEELPLALTPEQAEERDLPSDDEANSSQDLLGVASPTRTSSLSPTSPGSRTSSLPQSPPMTPSVTITPPRTSSALRESGEVGRDFLLTWEGEPGRLILSPERLTFRPSSPVQAVVHPFLSIPYELIYAVSISPKDPAITLIHTIHPRDYSLCSFRITDVDPTWLVHSLRAHLPPSPPYAHVFINPYAGIGEGLELWEGLVRPMLLNARIPHAVTVTTGPGDAESHAGVVALEENKDAFSPSASSTSSDSTDSSSSSASSSFRRPAAIICIGGDGLVHEVVNGLASRGTPRPVVQLCVIPAGTGNTVANAVIHQEGSGDIVDADTNTRSLRSLLTCFRCQHTPLDLATVALTDGRIRRAVALVNAGFHADITSSSDRLRFLGPSSRSRLAGAVQYLFPTQALDKARITLLGARRWSASYRSFSSVESVVELEDGPYADILVTNHAELSHGYRIAPFADPSDGFWDLIVIRGGRSQVNAVQSAATSPHPSHLAKGLAECWQVQGLHLQIPHLGESVRVDGEALALPPAGDEDATVCELTLQVARDDLIRLCRSA